MLETKKYTLLIVDDEDKVVKALRRLLRKEGYQIHTANSGREALEILILTLPFLVNLTELLARLSKIWRNLTGSDIMVLGSGKW